MSNVYSICSFKEQKLAFARIPVRGEGQRADTEKTFLNE